MTDIIPSLTCFYTYFCHHLALIKNKPNNQGSPKAMFHQLNQQCRKSRYIAPLLLLVFTLCWGQNFGWLDGCPKHQQASATEQITDSHATTNAKHESAKADCEKTTHLLQQFQPDITYAALSFFVLLVLALQTVVHKHLPPPPFFFSCKRRPHAVFCCFLE
ncbi:hypothetical protein [Idiomarina loihiensis]|nr:hypothetical protein [Idiomarina loihiensis]